MFEALEQVPLQLGEESIQRILGFARKHLGMDVAWISHVIGNRQVIEYLDGDTRAFGVAIGSSPQFELGARVVSGELPPVIADVSAHCEAGSLASSNLRGIGAYAGIPLKLADGRLYGMLCCLSRAAQPSLQPRDAQFLQLVAGLVLPSINEHDRARHQLAESGARIQAVLDSGGPSIWFQPIVSVARDRIVAIEALARFPRGHASALRWFSEATEVGLGTELELVAVNNALKALAVLKPAVRIAVNVSADSARHPDLCRLLAGHDAGRICVQITGREQATDYSSLGLACKRLRRLGCRIAVDDAGTGYAGFQRLVELRPDIIKLDHRITHNIDADPVRAALAAALVGFAQSINAIVLAEGIETAAELAMTRRLGIRYGQGYHLGRPAPLDRELMLADTQLLPSL
jgi:EAL domain-containing protein (putative c-di-GMP-specific phosphodiesterase class I)